MAQAIPAFSAIAVEEIQRRLKQILRKFIDTAGLSDFQVLMENTGAAIVGGVASCVLTESALLSSVFQHISPMELDLLMPNNKYKSSTQWEQFLISVGYTLQLSRYSSRGRGEKVTKFQNRDRVSSQTFHSFLTV
jgi:hypothetical protein